MADCIVDRDRRQGRAPSAALHALLNDDQLMALRDLERYGWELKFVRRPLFQDVIPVVIDGDRKALSVLRTDGTLDEHPSLRLRD